MPRPEHPASADWRSGMADQLESQVRDALAHLHDLARLQTHPLARPPAAASGGRARELAGRALRADLIEAIEALRPGPDAGADPHAGRGYRLLRRRYLDGRPAPAIQAELALSKSEYYRDLGQAVAAVASALRARWSASADVAQSADGDSRVPRPGQLLAPAPPLPGPRPWPPLPAPLDSFVGRERELAELAELLQRARLLTLTGPPGTGKTRLAIEATGRLGHRFDGRRAFVPLASAADADLVLPAIAAVLGVRPAGDRSLAEALVSYLRGTRGLLVLDNLEHLTAAAGAIADLVAACPALVVLATSRTPLLVAGEQEYLVPPLAVPDAAEAPSLDRLQQVGAVRLLVDRARAVQPRFALTDDNAAAVAEVCRRLDGLPLAIELAAARVRVLSVAQIAARLGEAFGPAGLADPADRHPDHGGRFRLLTSESATVEQRHRTLWATLEWSHALLSEAEAVLLRRLSVFAGGWTLEAAEAVCGLEPLEPFGLLDLLTGLVAKSLVVAEPDGGEVRYRLLETIRSYAGRKLDRAGETAVVRGGHLAWCLGLAEQAAAEIHGRRGTAWLARLAREQDNLRAALAWTRTSAERLAAGLQLAGALQRFWFLHLHGRDEGRRWLDGLLEQAEQAGWPGVSPTVRARALQGAGEMRHGRDFAARATLIGQALELYRAAGDQHRLAECLCLMGDAARYCGDDARGFALVEESLALGRQLGDEEVVAFALYELGALELNRHRHERARALAGECLSLAREVGGPWVLPLALRLMGRAAMSVGDFQLAKTVLAEDLLLEQERGITGGPMTRRFLGDIALREGDGRSAAGHFAAALALAQEVGSTWEIGSALIGLAGAARLGGRHARAARLLGAGERLTVATAARPATFQAASPEPLIAATRLSLGDEPFAAAWAEGQRMTLDQAIAYAQGDD